MLMDAWDEKRLVSLLKQGDEDAFRIMVRQYQKKLFSIAYGITMDREESRDIVQEVFIKVHERIATFRETSRLSTWLHRITVNLSLNWMRRWKRRFRWHHQPIETDDSLDNPAVDDNNPEKLYDNGEMASIVWDRLKKLPEAARTILILRDIEGLSYDEIAEVLRIKRGTVNSRLFHARKKMKAALKRYMEEPP